MSGPWRKVRDDVRLCEGPKGGRYWYVTLEPCGHLRSIPIPPLREHQIAMIVRRQRLSPHRARCLICPEVSSTVSASRRGT